MCHDVSSACSRLGLQRARRAPERTWINPLWIEREHLVVEIERGRRRLLHSVEVADILTRLLKDLGAVVTPSTLVSGDDGAWVQSRNCVEGRQPLAPRLGARLAQVEMDIVVDGVAGD